MPNELTNLLPPNRSRALRRDYFLRLGVVAALIATALAGIAAVLLLPAYMYLAESTRAKEIRLTSLNAALFSADDAILSARLKSLESDVATLARLDDAPTASAVIQTALAVAHPGITLTSFAYAPATSKKKGTLAITGIALTRAALRNYQLAFGNVPLFISADLPVSAYAKDTDSVFTVTLTLAS